MIRHPLTYTITALLLLAGCASVAPPVATTTPAPQPDAVIKEAWISPDRPQEEIDSLAAWPTENGGAWLIATASSSNQLVVFDADSGRRLRSVGGPGDGPSQFRRPSGIAIWADLAFVVERDNHRVQVLQLPDFTPRGFIGSDTLKAPDAVWLRETAPDVLELLVSDTAMADSRTGMAPGAQPRLRRFSVQWDQDAPIASTDAGGLADDNDAGTLRPIQAIAGDPAHDRLLVAAADQGGGSTLRDFALDGRPRGTALAHFSAPAAGIALWDCAVDDGWWIATDQGSPTLFRVYDRANLAPVGSFAGSVDGPIEGQTLYAAGTPRFPGGALFVQRAHHALAAFDLREIARALGLRGDCLQ